MDQQKKLERLTEDHEFMDRIAMANTPEEIVEILHAEGIAIGLNELLAASEAMYVDTELSEDELDYVAGGKSSFWGNVLRHLATITYPLQRKK